jgi:hypothetical protein
MRKRLETMMTRPATELVTTVTIRPRMADGS